MRAAAFIAIALIPGAAAALDCAAASNTFLRSVCGTPAALAEWHKMDRVLQEVLADAPDQVAKDMLQASQDRWLSMMGGWDTDATRTALSTRGAGDSFEVQLADSVANRASRIPIVLGALATARADLARLSTMSPPGLAVSNDTDCFFVEPEVMPNGHWDTFCGGTLSLQKDTRICSVMTYWYSGHVNHVFSVDDVTDGQLTHRGNCDWNGLAPDCPDADDGSAANPHWDSQPSQDVSDIHKAILNHGTAPLSSLSPVDPESWPDVYPDDWFATCLTTPDYPPPDQVWAGDGPKP